jgi:hypothetical protein
VAVTHAALTELAAAIDTEVQVDIVTMPAVDLGATDNAVLDAIAASVAAIDTDTSTIITAVQLIDDVVYVDDTAVHATGTSKGVLIMGAATPTDTAVSANDIGAIAMTNNRGMHVSVQEIVAGDNNIGNVDIASIAAGDNNIGNVDVASSALPTGASTLAEQQSQTTHLATVAGAIRTEDTASAGGQTGMVAMAIRQDTPAASSDTDGDYEPLKIANGRLAVNATVSGALLTSSQLIDDAAHVHDAGSIGTGMHVVGGMANTMDDTAPPNRVSAESDSTRLATSMSGAVFAHPHAPQVWSYHLDTSTAQTDTEVHASAGAGLSLFVTDVVFSNVGTAAINLFFEEGSTKKLGPYYLPAAAGGLHISFAVPKKMTAATALTLTTSASHAHCVDVTGYVEVA